MTRRSVPDLTTQTNTFRSGFASIVGRPNVGKSTLMNQLLGEKFVIVTDKPQTTRNRIRCILTRDDMQVVFIDTPGIHKPHHKLGEYMVKAALRTLQEVDVVVLVVDGTEAMGRGDDFVLEQLKGLRTPVVLLLNKTDVADPSHLDRLEKAYRDRHPFQGVYRVSALSGDGVAPFLDGIYELLSPGPMYYPEDMVIDHPERFVVAEMIREKIIQLTQDEIPHSVAIEIEEMVPRSDDMVFVRAIIYVERDSQKGIVIGAGGQLLRQIGQQAREDIEGLLGSRVYLDLWVRVKKDWRSKDGSLKELGYD
jgi:GTP-binding protein Era